eukprot:jgi/Astpho2/4741/Aster-00292
MDTSRGLHGTSSSSNSKLVIENIGAFDLPSHKKSYVYFEVGTANKSTSMDKEDLASPFWSDTVTFDDVPADLAEESIKVAVYNHAALLPDHFVGGVEYPLSHMTSGQSLRIPLTDRKGNSAGEISFTLEVQGVGRTGATSGSSASTATAAGGLGGAGVGGRHTGSTADSGRQTAGSTGTSPSGSGYGTPAGTGSDGSPLRDGSYGGKGTPGLGSDAAQTYTSRDGNDNVVGSQSAGAGMGTGIGALEHGRHHTPGTQDSQSGYGTGVSSGTGNDNRSIGERAKDALPGTGRGGSTTGHSTGQGYGQEGRGLTSGTGGFGGSSTTPSTTSRGSTYGPGGQPGLNTGPTSGTGSGAASGHQGSGNLVRGATAGGGSQSTYGTGTGSDSARGSYSTPGTQDPQGATKDDTGRGYTGSRETGATGTSTTSSSQQGTSSTAGMSAFQKLKSAIPGTAEHKQTHPQTGSDYDSTSATPKHGSTGSPFGTGADSRTGGESPFGTGGNSSTAGQKASSGLPGTPEHSRTHGNTSRTGTDSGYTAQDDNDNVALVQALGSTSMAGTTRLGRMTPSASSGTGSDSRTMGEKVKEALPGTGRGSSTTGPSGSQGYTQEGKGVTSGMGGGSNTSGGYGSDRTLGEKVKDALPGTGHSGTSGPSSGQGYSQEGRGLTSGAGAGVGAGIAGLEHGRHHTPGTHGSQSGYEGRQTGSGTDSGSNTPGEYDDNRSIGERAKDALPGTGRSGSTTGHSAGQGDGTGSDSRTTGQQLKSAIPGTAEHGTSRGSSAYSSGGTGHSSGQRYGQDGLTSGTGVGLGSAGHGRHHDSQSGLQTGPGQADRAAGFRSSGSGGEYNKIEGRSDDSPYTGTGSSSVRSGLSGAQHEGTSTEGMTTFQKIKSVIPGTAEHKETHDQTGSQYGTDDARYGQEPHNQGQNIGHHHGSSTSGMAEHDRRSPMHGGGSYETGTGAGAGAGAAVAGLGHGRHHGGQDSKAGYDSRHTGTGSTGGYGDDRPLGEKAKDALPGSGRGGSTTGYSSGQGYGQEGTGGYSDDRTLGEKAKDALPGTGRGGSTTGHSSGHGHSREGSMTSGTGKGMPLLAPTLQFCVGYSDAAICISK